MPRRRFQMPSVERRDGKKSYWRIRYGVYLYINGTECRKQKSKFLGYCPTTNDLEMRKCRAELTKREAERIAAKFMEGINGQGGVAVGSQVKLKDFVVRWLSEHVSGLATPSQDQYHWAVDKHILPELGDRQLGDLTTELIQRWLNQKTLAWASKCALRATLRVIYAKAGDWGYWEGRNPVERVSSGKKRTVYDRRLLSDKDAERLIAELPETVQLIVAVLRATGCRISEVLGLEWRHVDTAAGWVTVEQRIYHGEIDVVKSEAGRREIPIGEKLATRLRAIQQPTGYVFVMDEAQLRGTYLVPTAKRLGLYFKGFGAHSFRREVSTLLQEHGASSIEAAIWLGHTKPSMTQRYTLVQRKRLKDLARKMEGDGEVTVVEMPKREVG